MLIVSSEKVKIDKLTWFKEGVTACLGVMIIVGMLLLLWPLLSGETPDITNAQAIFSILGGWGGIVLGYYFGRMPAERAATRADAVASAARTAKDDAVATEKTTLAETEILISRMEEKLKKYQKLIASWRERIDKL